MAAFPTRYARILCTIFAMPLLIGGAPSVTFAEDKPLIENGNFEAEGQNVLPGWTHHTGLGGKAELVGGTGQVRTGQKALRLQPETGRANPTALVHTAPVKMEPGKRYRATAWAKGKGRFELTFYQYGPQRNWLSGAGLGAVRITEAWQPYVLHYGNPPEGVAYVAVVVQAQGTASEVFVDDVSFEVVELPVGPEGPANGQVQADGAGPGAAAGWSGPASRMRVEASDGGGFCQRYDAAMFAADARGALQPADYFNYPIASAVTPPTWLSFQCEPFAVEPGTTQEISFLLRADQVHTFHIKLRYFQANGEPYDNESGVRPYYTLGGTRDGSWPTQRFVCQATSPTTAGKAQLEFWCLCGGGTLWADDLAVKTLVAPPIHSSHMLTQWHRHSDEVASARKPARWRSRPATRGSAPKRSLVEQVDGAVVARFPNGLRVALRLDGERVLGIGEVSLAGMHFRSPEAPLLAPLVETEEGGKYAACLYRGSEVTAAGEVVFHTELQEATGTTDQLDWFLAPHEQKVGGAVYCGLALRYAFRSRQNHVLQIVDRATWELGGNPLGLTVVDQNSYAGQNVFSVTEDNPYCSGNGVRFVGGECLDYQFAPEGALFSFFEEPCFVRYQRVGTPEFILFRDSHQFAGTTEATTTTKYILFAPDPGSHDRWLRARDFAYARARAQANIVAQTPLPLANVWAEWQELARIGKANYYQKILDDYLPALARSGFKRLMVHETWEHGGCSPSDLIINSEFGGEETLKRLCDAARTLGIEVIAWHGPGHLWTQTPLFQERPDFRLLGRGDEPPTSYCWPDITGVDLTGPWFEHAIDRLKGIRQRTGLGGFWLDSYTNFTHNVRCATRDLEIRQAEALPRLHAAIQQLGYITYTEASSDFGIKANGFPVGGLDSPDPAWPAPEELVDTSPYNGGWKEEYEIRLAQGLAEGDRYFRYLANKCVPFVYWRRFRDQPEWQETIGRVNRVYNAVVEFMAHRTLLPEDRGVAWESATGRERVVFAFRDQELAVPKGKKAVVAPAMTPVAVNSKQVVKAKAGETYLLR